MVTLRISMKYKQILLDRFDPSKATVEGGATDRIHIPSEGCPLCDAHYKCNECPITASGYNCATALRTLFDESVKFDMWSRSYVWWHLRDDVEARAQLVRLREIMENEVTWTDG